jgi:hypothetical protein
MKGFKHYKTFGGYPMEVSPINDFQQRVQRLEIPFGDQIVPHSDFGLQLRRNVVAAKCRIADCAAPPPFSAREF